MKKAFIGIAAAASMLSTLPVNADVSVSGNLGVMSDYFFRGIFQSDSVANGGLDLEAGGFYLGTWAAEQLGSWAVGLLAAQLGSCAVRQLGSRAAGQLASRVVGQLGSLADG